MIHACTIDLEDYYHVTAFERAVPRSRWAETPSRVEAATETLLAILAETGVRAEFFVLGRVVERCPQLIRRIRAAGHSLACHSDDHELVYRLTAAQFRADVRAAKRRIEDAAGVRVRAYRAPSFSITRASTWALEILVEEGFEVDSSVYPVRHDRYGLPGAWPGPQRLETPAGPIVEFPPTSVAMFGGRWPCFGGGYFRLYPYAVTKWCGRQAEAAGFPINLYLHPWEFDPEQPRVTGLNLSARFRHYVGLHRTAERFRRILRDFAFGTLDQALAGVPSLPVYRVGAGGLEPLSALAGRVAVASVS